MQISVNLAGKAKQLPRPRQRSFFVLLRKLYRIYSIWDRRSLQFLA
jgi:hypothetical protein